MPSTFQSFIFLAVIFLFGLSYTRVPPTLSRRSSTCNKTPWDPVKVKLVGGTHGEPFCFTKLGQGHAILGMTVWTSPKGIEAMQFVDSNRSPGDVFGQIHWDHEKHFFQWDWMPGEDRVVRLDKFRELKIWDNGKTGKDRRLSRIYIKLLSTQREFDVGPKDVGGQEFNIPVDSGILLGIIGRSAGSVSKLGFLFSKTIKKITVSDFEFNDDPQDLNKRKHGFQTLSTSYKKYSNDVSKEKIRWQHEGEYTVQHTKQFFSNAMRIFNPPSQEYSGKIIDLKAEKNKMWYEWHNGPYKQHDGSMTRKCKTGGDLSPREATYCRTNQTVGSYETTYKSKASAHK